MRRGLCIGAFVVLAALLAGCGGSGPDGQSSTATTPSTTATGADGSVSRAGSAAASSARPGDEGRRPRQDSSKKSTSPPARGLPRCRASALVVWPEAGKSSVAAGTVYHQMTITNLSRRACSLSGYPSAVVIGRGGEVIGKSTPVPELKPTQRNPRRLVALARLAGSAHYMLTYNDGTAAGPCKFATSFGLRVRLPGARRAPTIPFSTSYCTKAEWGAGVGVGRIE